MNHTKNKIWRFAILTIFIALALALPASASMNETGAIEAWIKSDLRGNQSTNQTIISIPAEISNDGGLVGLWHTNENSGNMTNDSSGLGNDGTCYGVGGQVCNWTVGRFGYGVLFDGVDVAERLCRSDICLNSFGIQPHDYVNVSDDVSLDITDEVHI